MIFNLLFLVILLLTITCLFLSIWIVLPASNLWLLPLAVAVPEFSPLLTLINIVIFFIAILLESDLTIVISFISIILTCIPWFQMIKTIEKYEEEMNKKLGNNYQEKIPLSIREKMRSRPFILQDIWRGIKQKPVRITRGIKFAQFADVSLCLNLYQPLTTGKYPTLIIIYGGAWRKGSPDNDEIFSCYIAHQGYTVITLDYRHAPQYHFPTQVEDINSGLLYIKNNADSLEVDLDYIAIMGRSAGGQLAFLTAYDSSTLKFKGLINYYAPVNLTLAYQYPAVPDPIDTRKVLIDYLGGTLEEVPNLYHQASPINHIHSHLPPTLLIYPERDHIVPVKVGKIISNKLKEYDNCHVLLTIPWAEHAFDAIFSGLSNQIALYYTERFLAFTISK